MTDNSTDWWQPELISTLARTYEITVDMKQVQTIHGIKIVQKAFDKADSQSASLMPGMIKVKVSTNKISRAGCYIRGRKHYRGNEWRNNYSLFPPIHPMSDTSNSLLMTKFMDKNFSVSLAEIGVF